MNCINPTNNPRITHVARKGKQITLTYSTTHSCQWKVLLTIMRYQTFNLMVQSTIFYIWKCLYQVRNMTVLVRSFFMRFVIWFCHVIMDFPNWLSSEFSIFVILHFLISRFLSYTIYIINYILWYRKYCLFFVERYKGRGDT